MKKMFFALLLSFPCSAWERELMEDNEWLR